MSLFWFLHGATTWPSAEEQDVRLWKSFVISPVDFDLLFLRGIRTISVRVFATGWVKERGVERESEREGEGPGTCGCPPLSRAASGPDYNWWPELFWLWRIALRFFFLSPTRPSLWRARCSRAKRRRPFFTLTRLKETENTTHTHTHTHTHNGTM